MNIYDKSDINYIKTSKIYCLYKDEITCNSCSVREKLLTYSNKDLQSKKINYINK